MSSKFTPKPKENMKILKKSLALVAIAAALSLSACSYSPGHEGTVSDPAPVSENFTTTNYELEDGFAVTCISKGSGKTAALSCVTAQESAKDLVSITDSAYHVIYREFEDGRTLPCLEKGSGKTYVISCVEQAR